jgi:hypothetical protein
VQDEDRPRALGELRDDLKVMRDRLIELQKVVKAQGDNAAPDVLLNPS